MRLSWQRPACGTGPAGALRLAGAATYTLNPAADNYVSEASPSNNYGTNIALQVVAGQAGAQMKSYLKFEVAHAGPRRASAEAAPQRWSVPART
jgi:hypothetical protein